ncbi:MAG: hypothetical protein KAI35_08755 [Desulfobulbaceae bacterium]|nr:hypothetical protein [Desulfobulbaceae bacterium]
MTNYLARIVTRAKGTSDSESIKPVIQSWPIDNSGNNSNPFKEEIAPDYISPDHEDMPLPEHRSLPQVKPENPAISLPPFDEKNRPVNIGQPIFDQPDKIIHPSPSPFGESVVPLSPSDEANMSVNIDQPVADQKPEGIDTQASKKTGKAEKVVFDSESFSPVRRPHFETGSIHKQPLIQDLENKIVIKEQHIPEPDKTNLGPVQQSTPESDVHELSPNGSKKNKKSDRQSDAPVQMLSPPVLIDSTPPTIPKKTKMEPRLVIGRLMVEVVTPPSAKPKQTAVRAAPRAVKSAPSGKRSSFSSKLRFGLGQV